MWRRQYSILRDVQHRHRSGQRGLETISKVSPLGVSPVACAFLFSRAAVAVIGPLADRGEFNPDTPIGIVFSLTMGLAFLFMGITPGPKTDALELLWGSILTVTRPGLALLAAVALSVALLVTLFFKEIQAVIFHREVALAVGLPANLIFYAMLVLTGAAITVSLSSIGGLLIFIAAAVCSPKPRTE